MALTDAEKSKRKRNKKRDAGLVKKEIWVRPDLWKEIQAYIKKRMGK